MTDALPKRLIEVDLPIKRISAHARREKSIRHGHISTRRTPWGEIAYQLGGTDAFAVVADHDERGVAPGGDVIRRFLPIDRPCLILMDELMNYISRLRRAEPAMIAQFYNFLQNFSEEARARSNLVLAVSVPKSEEEMNADDLTDYDRLKKLLDRVGKAVIMSVERETAEIIRRRLFQWEKLPRDAGPVAEAYAKWIRDHRQFLPEWFPVDHAREEFERTYPFHPITLSVFERKWQSIRTFQRTRGTLRLLALWVSKAYREGYQGLHHDLLIALGTAPLDDSTFREAALEQLGERRMAVPVAADIGGRDDSHAIRLDAEAPEAIREIGLHRKVAAVILFESNGGQARGEATEPEIRLAVSEPGLDIGNVETALEGLAGACYYLETERKRYRFALSVNLNKLLADRRASIDPAELEDKVRKEIEAVFSGSSIKPIFFPTQSNQIPDGVPQVSLAILPPSQTYYDQETAELVSTFTREVGQSTRLFQSSLIWVIPDNARPLYDEARKWLALMAIRSEDESDMNEPQRRQLSEMLERSKRDLREAVWRVYKHVILLGKDNDFRHVDMGLINSSAGPVVTQIVNRLRQEGDIEDNIGANFLVRNWSGVGPEWATKDVRNAFYASPQMPRLLDPDRIRDTIAAGVRDGRFAYVGKNAASYYDPFCFNQPIEPREVEIADDVYILQKEAAEHYVAAQQVTDMPPTSDPLLPPVPTPPPSAATSVTPLSDETVRAMRWNGTIPSQKWTLFYNKVITKLVNGGGLQLTVTVDAEPNGGISPQRVEEIRAALRELGIEGDLDWWE